MLKHYVLFIGHPLTTLLCIRQPFSKSFKKQDDSKPEQPKSKLRQYNMTEAEEMKLLSAQNHHPMMKLKKQHAELPKPQKVKDSKNKMENFPAARHLIFLAAHHHESYPRP